ncbi:hypothetical protein [Streptomyces sp. URMC 124]|uniref:hypothetical protein n=1 Tax=Streptomyces sp. URMC 124 TaxID=3423405 RepID=UPI003F1A7610
MTNQPEILDIEPDEACPSGLCDQIDDCETCAGNGDCVDCGGNGWTTPDHCCACGGSPYCTCCPNCSATYIGACDCPIEVTLADGSTPSLPPARDEDDSYPACDDDHDPQPPEGYYDDHVPAGNEPAGRQWSSEPPFPDDRPAPTTEVDYWPPF